MYNVYTAFNIVITWFQEREVAERETAEWEDIITCRYLIIVSTATCA